VLSRPVLLYDGRCGFCRIWVRRLRRWDRAGRIDYVPYQLRSAVGDLPWVPDEALGRAMHFVVPGGRIDAGARALPAILGYLPGGALIRLLFKAPGMSGLADRVYRWVATHRHQLGGPGATCEAEPSNR
jgi:predicted DCC family thiol-disulfide oxidoreductase YuxK